MLNDAYLNVGYIRNTVQNICNFGFFTYLLAIRYRHYQHNINGSILMKFEMRI